MKPEIYVDTHVITLYNFLDAPQKFLPEGIAEGDFYICMPILRELELIKDNHISKGQRNRARNLLNMFRDNPMAGNSVSLSSLINLKIDLTEPTVDEHNLFKPVTPDDQFVAKVCGRAKYGSQDVYLLSNDGGVILRANYGSHRNGSPRNIICYSPPEEERLVSDDDTFSQNFKGLVKQFAIALTTELTTNIVAEE